MKLYAELPRLRTRQLTADLLTVVWIALWIRLGLLIHDLVGALATPGRIVEGAGRRLVRSARGAAAGVEDVPVVGDQLRSPFQAIAAAGRSLAESGVSQQEAVATLAVWLGVVLAAIPIAYLLLRYLPRRVRWIREATAAEHIRFHSSDLQVFALRAVANRPLSELRAATSDPGAALAAGAYEDLARLELQALGLDLKDVAST
jgi:hypothetical protein